MTDSLSDVLETARQLGYLGPGPVETHLHHARAFARVVETVPSTILDLGAGGGVPGLVLAVEDWPEARWCLLDAQTRRTDFLLDAVARLGLGDRVDVRTGRAEVVGRENGYRERFDLVVSRSFGAPPVTAECAAPFLVVGGCLVVSEPPMPPTAPRWPASGVAKLGFGPAVDHALDTEDGSVHLAVLTKQSPIEDKYPRRDGQPAKRPLW